MTIGLLVVGLAASQGLVAAANTPMAAYAEAVEEYESGDRQRAIQDVLGCEPLLLARWTAAVVKPRSGSAPPDRFVEAVRERFPAAVMLHTQAGLILNWRNDAAGARRQWRAAETLAQLEPATAAQSSFLRRWHHAFGLFFLGSYDLDQSIEILERGRRRFPDDVPIALALGQAHEARGSAGAIIPSDLAAAEAIYRDLLARQPSLAEARLRLGRVLATSGRRDLALTELRQTATLSADPRLRYLARLFAGNLLRQASRLPEAELELSLALDAWPAGQAAALSLAEALHSRDERTAAAAVLSPAIAGDAVTPGPDPWRSYQFGDRADHKRLLEAVVELASR